MSLSRWLAWAAAFSVFCVLKVSSLDTFLAAVYEHAVILPKVTLLPVSHSEALALMNQNLDLLEGAILSAAKQGAHIIVTPEDGIYGVQFTRDTIYPYLEDIPDPQVNWIPCDNPERRDSAAWPRTTQSMSWRTWETRSHATPATLTVHLTADSNTTLMWCLIPGVNWLPDTISKTFSWEKSNSMPPRSLRS